MTYLAHFLAFLAGAYCGMTILAMFITAKRKTPKPPGATWE